MRKYLTQGPFVRLLAGLAPFYLLLLFISTYSFRVPFSDQWEHSARIAIDVEQGTLDFDALIEPMKGQRIFFVHLVTAINAVLGPWNPQYELVFTVVVACCNLGLLLYLVKVVSPEILSWVWIPFSALIFSVYQVDLWIYSWNSCWILVLTWLLLGLILITQKRPTIQTLIGLWILGLMAAFTFPTGIITLPVWGMALWIWGYRRGVILLWPMMALVIVWLALFSSGRSDESGFAIPRIQEIPDLIQFLLAYLGSPLSLYIHDVDFAIVVGLMGVMTASGCLYILYRANGLQAIAVWLSLILFSLGAGVLIAITRLDTTAIYQATSTRYAIMSTVFWLAIAGMLASVLWLWSHDSYWLKNGVVGLALIFAGFYLQSNFLILQVTALEYDRVLGYQHNYPIHAETCLASYPLYEEDCQPEFPFGGGASPFFVDRLAAYGLSIYADDVRVSIMPQTALSDSPIIISLPTVWRFFYIRDRLLKDVELERILAVAPDVDASYDVSFPYPLVHYESVLTDENILNFVGDHEQFWYLRPNAIDDRDILEKIISYDYFATVVPIGVVPYQEIPLTLFRFQKPPKALSEKAVLGDLYTLIGSQTPEVVQPCDVVAVQTWWVVNTPPPINYSATVTLISPDGVQVQNSDGELAQIPAQLWEPEKTYLDERLLTIPCDLESGLYHIEVGIYDYLTFYNLPLQTNPDLTRAFIAPVNVIEPTAK